jgi:mercuric ion binding protein
MKNLLLVIAMLLTSTSFALTKEVKVSVKGMVCGFCAQGISKKLKAESAVASVDVSLEKKLVTVQLKDGEDIKNERIESILKDSGYNVEKIERP